MSRPDRTMYGGVLKDIPKPHRRWFDDKRRKRGVRVSIANYDLIGAVHFWATVKEDDDWIWDSKEKIWRQLHEGGTYGRSDTFQSKTYKGAVQFVTGVIREKYSDGHHTIEWDSRRAKRMFRVMYAREGD